MTSTTLPASSLSEAAELIRRGDLSPLELLEACIARTEHWDREVGAFITLTLDDARREAKFAGEEIAKGRYQGPLHGVPLGLKDLVETAGVPTTAASPIREHYVPEADAHVAGRLRQAGAVLMGKLNMHEWAFGTTNTNKYFSWCRNPWDLTRIPGGSSGGSAAAVAADFCLGTLGSDTAGSIRIPASFCGITGLKPTFGRVSTRGVVPLAWSLDHVGPMARTATDCALILQVIAGFDPQDPSSLNVPPSDWVGKLDNSIKGVRVGVPTNFFFDAEVVNPEVSTAVQEVGAALQSLGVRLSRVTVPLMERLAEARVILLADAAAYHREHLARSPEGFNPQILELLRAGERITGAEYALARRFQAEVTAAFEQMFEEIDILLCPTMPGAAPTIEEANVPGGGSGLPRNVRIFNLPGCPAISVPCGFTLGGLPIGAMLVGRKWDEATVLQVAHAYQTITDWHTKRPVLVPLKPDDERGK